MQRTTPTIGILSLGLALAVTACGDDASTATPPSTPPSSVAPVDPLVDAAVDGYRSYVEAQVDAMLVDAGVLADAVRAGDLDAAAQAYPASRRAWERIEPIAGLIADVDGAVDAREDGFDGPEDPDFTGWHKLEWFVFAEQDLTGAGPYADRLEADLRTLADAVPDLELAPDVLTVGAQELIEEVAAPGGKLSGEEDRYSGTDLYDFQANVEGSEALVELLAPAVGLADPDLLATVRAQFEALDAQLGALGGFDEGYPHYDTVTDEQRQAFAATLGELAESLSLLNGTLGLG